MWRAEPFIKGLSLRTAGFNQIVLGGVVAIRLISHRACSSRETLPGRALEGPLEEEGFSSLLGGNWLFLFC